MGVKRISRSPSLLPAVLVITAALLLAANPARSQVLASLLGGLRDPVRWIPLAPHDAIPTTFAKWLWGCALFGGWYRLARERFSWRTWVYGIVTLPLYSAAGMVLWTTTIEWWGSSRWFSDAAQGWFIMAFVVAYSWGVVLAVRYWLQDLAHRCPECLARLCMPLQRGSEYGVLIQSSEVESICIHGHGAMRHTRWSRTFHPVTGFWKQLLK